MAIGRSAAHSIFCNSAICVRPGQIGTSSARGASATAAISVSMSSGSAITTGPGRPCIADVKRALDNLRDLRGGLDLRRELRGRGEQSPIVHLLESAPPHHRPLDLAYEQDHRRRIVLGDMQPMRGVGRAGATGDETDSRASGQPPFG